MSFSIKEISQNIEITEQGLYKRIKTNYKEYKKKKFIELNQVEQPNGTTKEQIFITNEGIKDLLKTKNFRKEADLQKFKDIIKDATKPKFSGLNQVEQPLNQSTKPKNTETASDSLLNLLNQNIADLKEENKRLNAKLERQEERFDKKLEEQKQEFKEQYEKQQELYQKTLDKLMQSFQNALLQLPKPNEEEEEPAEIINDKTMVEKKTEAEEQPKKKKSLFSRLFSKE